MRKAKRSKSTNRRDVSRSSNDRVLLVCEGEKTEPNYFNGLVDHYKLNTANIDIVNYSGSSPIGVVNMAIDLWRNERIKRKEVSYDKVYCIFDKDTHESYNRALNKVSNKKYNRIFHAANSVPSFEYWLLLHYGLKTAPYTAVGSRSAADAVERELKQHFPDYSKGDKRIFSKLVDRLEDAKRNAEQSLNQAESQGTDNPSTKVHKLVDYLQNL